VTFEDYYEVLQVIARYGHVVDRRPDQFDTVFTADVRFDTTPVGGRISVGIPALLFGFSGSSTPPSAETLAQLDRPSLSHHTTNVEVLHETADEIAARSKYIRIAPDGVRAGTYCDRLQRTGDGWRISARTVYAHG
jgi:hypothetical protein